MENYPFYIGGEWRSGIEYDLKNPYDCQTIAKISRATKKDIIDAIDLAEKSKSIVSNYSVFDRQQILEKIIKGLKENSERIAYLIALEAGKNIKHAKAEVSRAITTFSVARDEVSRINGEVIPLDIVNANAGRYGIVKRFPVGVVLGITPFNFPLNLVAHKVAPAIAAGCPIIIKPATQTPMASLELAKIIESSGWEQGAFSVVTAKASDMEIAIKYDKVKKISFTGSPEVGFEIKKIAYDKKVTLELGGNAAAVVCEDVDIDDVVSKSVSGGFAYQGQVCIHLQRLYIHENIFDIVTKKLVKKVNDLKCGSQLNENTDIGPMINEDEAIRVKSWVDEAVKNGSRVLSGGNRMASIMEPTIISNCNHDEKVNSSEVFGPVLVLHKFSDFKEAITLVNNSKFGLQAGIFTNDIKKINYAFNNLEVGGVVVNDVPTFRSDNQPYGGVKQSGVGREGVKYAIEEMTELKILSLNPGVL
ncbi:MAG: aldehyde dehydrogenase family protein [Candidatus Delongbacteria bacterium]|nr:aldehyde dehydrogenase family protein [Candidatus Delongbacteria bacterium]MBN2833678.1 aldehyde dehydrogenase family protein [Candidatus Delongbacteria bacterium]